jgi:hypothetical protein
MVEASEALVRDTILRISPPPTFERIPKAVEACKQKPDELRNGDRGLLTPSFR